MLDLTPALLICVLGAAAMRRGVDLYEAMAAGAKKGLHLMAELLPTLTVLFAAIWLMRASGLLTLLGRLIGPILQRLAVPEETALLMLLRPLSGSGALAAASELITAHGPDSLVGRTAAVMIGSSETTLYVAAVYFTAADVKDTRWAIPAALCADLVCFLSSAWISRLLWG